MSDFAKYKDRDIAYIVDTFLYNNKDECKRLLGIFLSTKSESAIDRYYDRFEELREKGYFDPDENGFGLTWHWGAFFAGFFFYWYRRQYGMLPIIFILMFLWFFPSMIASAACAYATVLDSFCVAVARGLDHKKVQNRIKKLLANGMDSDMKSKIIDKKAENEDLDAEEAVIEVICEMAMPYIEAELRKRGGTIIG